MGPTPALGPSHQKKRSKKKLNPLRSSKAKRLAEKQQIEALETATHQFAGTDDLRSFTDLPISTLTKKGLKKAFFVEMTDVQVKSLPFSLKGKDILGAARTGSGKTLCFLIPVLEILYRRKWGPQDGLGALIISPTRELAVQIFDVLRSIGGYHSFSAGIVIGGKNLKDERERLFRMNILVATPGRLLQHMDQTVGFDCDNLQLLVLDEADRILDMGFSRTLSALLGHLPKSRQTLLFSATQTQSVSDLARLSLQDPIFISTDSIASTAEGSTHLELPANLEQHYALCPLESKVDVLWSFIKSHLQSKTLVFLSSAKQVRFVFEAFRRLHPGIPLLHLHGQQKQHMRLDVVYRFGRMQHAVLLATDLAARGLDFPSIDWVVQADAPEDAATYVHRVGRTARYAKGGQALLLLLPSEEQGMIEALKARGIEIQSIKIRGSKTFSIGDQLQRLAFQDPDLKYLAQRALVSYVRSVHLHHNKSIFKVGELPIEAFAASLGLAGAPKIRFLSRAQAKERKNASRDHVISPSEDEKETRTSHAEDSSEESNSGDEDMDSSQDEQVEKPSDVKVEKAAKSRVRTKYDRMFERKNRSVLSEHYNKLVDHGTETSDPDEDFITLKRADHDLPSTSAALPVEENTSQRRRRALVSKKGKIKYGSLPTRLVFDDDGVAHQVLEMKGVEEVFGKGDPKNAALEAGRAFGEMERTKMGEVDKWDKAEAKEKRKEKKRKRKEAARGERDSDEGVDGPTTGKGDVEDDGYVSPEFDLPSAAGHGDSPPPKKHKFRKNQADAPTSLGDEEVLALALLRGR
ncbi:DEAD-domain-containing protein [Lactarius akahatsu]|uniref:ATP-dependent RNA helicase n=1 Tax=Lactarius akahatsu TaxID=416441 RepID=A0AAD4L646_9AGAM|nr:DEAD-domain-containing protein [Lactarius akahatsu]